MRVTLWLWVACLMLTGSLAQAADRAIERELAFDGLTRTYVIHVPARLEGREASLVIALHGYGGDGRNVLEQGRWIRKADAEGFIVVAPEGVPERDDRPASFARNRRSWNSGPGTGSPAEHRAIDDVGFIRAVIEEVQRAHRVDARRIFVTGFSNGAAMAFRVAAELSDLIAAVAPVANGLLVPEQLLQQPVSLLLIWGEDDPLNPIAGGVVERRGQKLTRPSAEASWRRWAELIGCAGSATTDRSIPEVTARRFTGCAGGSSASLVTIAGLGHQWPGGRIYLRLVSGPGSDALNATDAIWSFFERHAR